MTCKIIKSAVKSELPSTEEIFKTEPIVEEPLPFLRSRMHDPLMFDFLVEDFTEELLHGNIQDELYDILGSFRRKNFCYLLIG